uniref:girdin-like isoform X2 n=1 Tax=Scatophagus argus TaxID=75038 RepID=UPI001ED81D53|nr:girdin-like isoform X2 [Scatophagus argus]
MQHSQGLDQRLHMLREEVRTMTQEKERSEQVWRDRLQRCQRQLKSKEEEMSRQSQYFENFKTQLQHKLRLARDREQSLQNRIYSLEKQLLDMTVNAATGMAVISAVRITDGTITHWEEQERLPSMRGEGEGEEERKEERRKQWQPSVEPAREGAQEGDEGKMVKEIQGGRVKETEQNSNEARLQGFILSLQEDLRVLLEREEDGMTERRGLMEQLQEAQEKSHFLGCKVEETKAKVDQLKQSESSLLEEVEELREENHRLQQILGDAAAGTPSQSTCLGPVTSLPGCNPAVCPLPSNNVSQTSALGHSSVGSSGVVSLTSEGTGLPYSSTVPPDYHQTTAESTQNKNEDPFSSARSETPPKNGPLTFFHHFGPKSNQSSQSFSLTTETLDEFKLGTWCSRGILNLEEHPSEESDALREAYRSLGLGADLEKPKEQRDGLEVALQQTREQLQMIAQENTRLKLQLKKEIDTLPTSERTEDNTLALTQDDLVQALNQENQALADRIQELLAHIEVREEEIRRENTQLQGHISKLEVDGVRLEQENQEQGCLITELTKKTEDDLNTIMELQQKLAEGEQHVGESQVDKELCEYTQNNLEEGVDSLKNMLEGEEPQLMSGQETDDSTSVSVPGSQDENHYDPLQSNLQSILNVSSLTDKVGKLTKSVQVLKTEQEDLSGSINSLRQQQREVALSIQTQTEVKQQLTRTVWRLKEEKDSISQSLSGLKQEREQLTRTVCGLKDKRDQLIRSTSGLEEHLTKSLSGHEREKEELLESLSSGKEERDQIMRTLQCLQTEGGQLSQAVLSLKQEKDTLTNSIKCLKEQRDKEQTVCTLQEDYDKLIKSVSGLREEKERIELSVKCLQKEEEQIKLLLQGLIEERDKHEAAQSGRTQMEVRNQKQHLLNPNSAVMTKKTETPVGTGEDATQRCLTNDHRGNAMQEQCDLMREIEALGAELKRSRDELGQSHVDAKRLRSELCQSEASREEAERKAAQAADEVMRLTDVANQMEETRKENDSLITQVKELQNKVTSLVREKSDVLLLKAQTEEQYNILTAQLKAKTVALEELNSEYIALKRGQGSRDDLSPLLNSLRTRYNDMRAKYDALLKKRSQTDLEMAPLKAKLSCLVVKCHERNTVLVQMMKAMRTRGCVDSTLTQQVEQLLGDAALQDYTAAFTAGSKAQDYNTGFTPGFISKFQDYTNRFTPDQTCSAVPLHINQQNQSRFAPESVATCGELKSEEHTFLVATESTSNQDCNAEVTPAPAGTLKKSVNSPVSASPVQERASPRFPVSISGSSLSPAPPSSSTHVSPRRRLSSPEKIINLHEQLQKTLMSSYQAPASRGRGQQPRKSLSFSDHKDLGPPSQTTKQSLGVSVPHTNCLPVTAASSPAKQTPAVTTTPVSTNKSTTLFNAVASRSADVTFSPSMFTNHHCKTDLSKTATLSRAKSTSSGGANITISPEKITATPDISHDKHAASTPLTPRASTFDSDVLICSDTNPKTTASDTTAQNISSALEANHFNMPSKTDGAAPAHDVCAASYTQSAQYSPERSYNSAGKLTAVREKTKTARPKPEAPAEVLSVEVIKTVGQSSLMIGWERPTLDELGCSNGTFVYGYRVFVDGDFHKSVMSSACTKCILENVDLSVPVQISVQTLGSNGLTSNRVHTMYRTSVRTEHH